MEHCTNPVGESPNKKSVDTLSKARYHSPQTETSTELAKRQPFKYEPVCVGCRTNSQFVFASGCEGCRERMRLLAKERS